MDLDRLQREMASPSIGITESIAKMEEDILDLQLDLKEKAEAMEALEAEKNEVGKRVNVRSLVTSLKRSGRRGSRRAGRRVPVFVHGAGVLLVFKTER